MLDSHRRRRPLRVLAYLLLAGGAGVLLVDPTRSLDGQAVWTRWVWSGFLLAGTLLAIYGSWRDRYMAEFIGLPFLLTALCVTWGPPGWVVAGLLFLGAGLVLTPLIGWAERSHAAVADPLQA